MTIFETLLEHDGEESPCVCLTHVSEREFHQLDGSEQSTARLAGFSMQEASIWPSRGDNRPVLLASTGKDFPSASNPWWMAGVCEKLPEGTYQFANTFGDDILRAGALGWLLAHYQFNRYKSELEPAIKRVLRLPRSIDLPPIIETAKSMSLVRDLVNTPAEDMGPAQLQAAIELVANEFGADCSSVVGDALLDQNFPAVHAVGRAAVPTRAPRVVDLRWGSIQHPSVTIVGKGVCFDSGGLNLKPGASMLRMKKDMAGGAHALGLARMIMMSDLPVRMRLIVPTVDNNISKESFRPGDILNSRKGHSIEIDNTDAEGRLILCDALALASEEKPDFLIDFATLTGANTVSVGPDLSGVYTFDDDLWDSIFESSKSVGDPVWRMPMWERYGEKLKSNIADINHRAPGFRYAGGTVAALFLNYFVEPETRWAHFDFSGWRDDALPARPVGSSVMGIRAVFEALKRLTSNL